MSRFHACDQTSRRRYCLCLLIAICACVSGCKQNRFFGPQGVTGWPAASNQSQGGPAQANQMQDFDRRANALDFDNRDLHAELAKSQQQVQLLNEKVNLLSKQLNDAANQIQSVQAARVEAEQQMRTFQASVRSRGGATITPNSSLLGTLPVVSLQGLEVRLDKDVIRIEIPADRIFQAGSAQLLPSAPYLIDQIADSIVKNYPRQMIGVEGHTDNSPLGAMSSHQLASAQALAVNEVLTTRSRLPSSQLFTVAHGANHPLASNATPAGRTRNRRVEVVVYPDTVGSR